MQYPYSPCEKISPKVSHFRTRNFSQRALRTAAIFRNGMSDCASRGASCAKKTSRSRPLIMLNTPGPPRERGYMGFDSVLRFMLGWPLHRSSRLTAADIVPIACTRTPAAVCMRVCVAREKGERLYACAAGKL